MSEREPRSAAARRLLAIGAVIVVCLLAAGASAIYVIDKRSGNEALAAADDCAPDQAFSMAIASDAKGEVAAVQPLQAPFDISSVSFADGDGKTRTIGEFAGKALLVNLWATWCVPCRAEMPALDSLERQKGGKDFGVIPINVDMGDADHPKGFYRDNNLTALPFYHDGTMGVFNSMKKEGVAFGLPVTLFVDRKGCARASINGGAAWASPDAIKLIDRFTGIGA